MAIELYPKREQVFYSFTHCKRETVPGQALSLREIVRRFIRRESLPVGVNDGVYEERFGDLEKFAREDMFDQTQRADEWRSHVRKFNERSQEPKPKPDEGTGSDGPPVVTGS